MHLFAVQTTGGRFPKAYTAIVFSLSFLAVALLNLPYLSMPPVWDTAAGVFAPAIYLYENGFDLALLQNQTGYLNGGPNIHSFSLITLLTYTIITLADGAPTLYLPVLHIIHYLIAAIVLTTTFLLANRKMGIVSAIILTIALLLFPLFLVQSSYLYTEITGSAFVLLAIMSWSSRRFGWMLLFCMLACMVKSFGIVLVALLLITMALDKSLPISSRLSWILLLIGIAVGIEMARWSIAPTPVAALAFTDISYLEYVNSIIFYLVKVPDLFFLIILSCLFPLLYLNRLKVFRPQELYRELSQLIQGSTDSRSWVAISLFPILFIGFIATIPLSGKFLFPLPRYYVWPLPFMLLIFGLALRELSSMLPTSWEITSQSNQNKFVFLVLSIITIFFGFNRNGAYYPYSGTAFRSFSIAERSFEYIDFYNIQLLGTKNIEIYNNGRPICVTRGEFYFLSSPQMGYIKTRLPNVNYILNHPFSEGNLSDFPDDFILLDSHSNASHGQHIVYKVLQQAIEHDDYQVVLISRHTSGPYKSALFRIYSSKEKIQTSDKVNSAP
jgi:hypothetical protein